MDRTMKDRSKLSTEQRLAASMALDSMSVEDAVDLMNQQDMAAVKAVGAVRAQLAQVIAMVVESFRAQGRLIYVGAGTSGRLGLLDAAECPPTFRTDPKMVQCILAGGDQAASLGKEDAEDVADDGAAEVSSRNVSSKDTVIGIAAGGTTPFVHGALRRARELGARTVFITCVDSPDASPPVDVTVRLMTGPEVVTGSTRLKAGTATKIALNTISTLAMVQIGKVYENLMVDLSASNIKLWDRAARIVSTLTGLDRDKALALVREAGGVVKVAVVMQRLGVSADVARERLAAVEGHLRRALEANAAPARGKRR